MLLNPEKVRLEFDGAASVEAKFRANDDDVTLVRGVWYSGFGNDAP